MICCVPLFSSSQGNSFYIKYKNQEILIDAGVSFKMLSNKLNSLGTDISNIQKILVTHEHSDHIKGLETISKNFSIPVFINSSSALAISKEKYPYTHENLTIADAGSEILTDTMKISIFKTPHDSMGSVGFRIEADNGDTLGYATDIGIITKGIAKNLCGCRTVVIESNHDEDMLKNGDYPYHIKMRILSDKGHLSNRSCGNFLPVLVNTGTEQIYLAHLSHHNNTPKKAFLCATDALLENGIKESDVKLCIAEGEF